MAWGLACAWGLASPGCAESSGPAAAPDAVLRPFPDRERVETLRNRSREASSEVSYSLAPSASKERHYVGHAHCILHLWRSIRYYYHRPCKQLAEPSEGRRFPACVHTPGHVERGERNRCHGWG